MEWSKKEIKHFSIAVILLTFIFGFNDGSSTFSFSNYFLNLVLVAIAAVILLLLYSVPQKIMASKYGCSSDFRLWSIKRYYFRPESTLPKKVRVFGEVKTVNHAYIGAVIGVLVALFSLGRGFFVALVAMCVTEHTKYRAGRAFRHARSIELAWISFAGMLTVMLFVSLAESLFGPNPFVQMGKWFTLFQLIPFSNLDGGRIFFNSIPTYVFTLVLAISLFVLSSFIGFFASVILSLVIALALFVVTLYRL